MANKTQKIQKTHVAPNVDAPSIELSIPIYVLFIGFIIFFIIFRFFRRKKWKILRPNRFINQWGYVVLSDVNELEHRYIAKNLLGRELASNEIVHHINGIKTDNKLRNLCLMDAEKHELFHTWLRWKKEKSGRYPAFSDQKRILENEYGGVLLENIKSNERLLEQVLPEKLNSPEKNNDDLQNKLFLELRKERKRIADEKGVPAYIVFDDKTLWEIAETMPESESLMAQINGVGPVKLRMYGLNFINVVRKFKNVG